MPQLVYSESGISNYAVATCSFALAFSALVSARKAEAFPVLLGVQIVVPYC